MLVSSYQKGYAARLSPALITANVGSADEPVVRNGQKSREQREAEQKSNKQGYNHDDHGGHSHEHSVTGNIRHNQPSISQLFNSETACLCVPDTK